MSSRKKNPRPGLCWSCCGQRHSVCQWCSCFSQTECLQIFNALLVAIIRKILWSSHSHKHQRQWWCHWDIDLLHTQGLLCMRPANERRRYTITSSVIGWAHTQNDPCIFDIRIADLLSTLRPLRSIDKMDYVKHKYCMIIYDSRCVTSTSLVFFTILLSKWGGDCCPSSCEPFLHVTRIFHDTCDADEQQSWVHYSLLPPPLILMEWADLDIVRTFLPAEFDIFHQLTISSTSSV